MANFWSLPEAVRKKIYRLHLIRNDAITFSELKESCRRIQHIHKAVPSFFLVSENIEREASNIYFGENTFKSRYLGTSSIGCSCFYGVM
jgi:hypothetical protein